MISVKLAGFLEGHDLIFCWNLPIPIPWSATLALHHESLDTERRRVSVQFLALGPVQVVISPNSPSMSACQPQSQMDVFMSAFFLYTIGVWGVFGCF